MFSRFFRAGEVILPFVLFFSFVLFQVPQVNVYESLNGLYMDNQYKLKFVDSVDYELGLSSVYKIILPIEILNMEEENGWIKLTSYENSVVYAPLDATIYSHGDEIKLKTSSLTIIIKNLLCGVKNNTVIKVGEIIGTINGSHLFVQVLWGERLLSIEEIGALL